MRQKLFALLTSLVGAFLLLVLVLNTTLHSQPIAEPEMTEILHQGGSTSLEWDDLDSRKWIGADWGMTDLPSSLVWGDFYSCACLEVRWDYPAWLGYIHSDKFPAENWEAPVIGLRASVYVSSSQSWTDIRLEPQNQLSTTIESIMGDAVDLVPGQWHTVTWPFSAVLDYQNVSGLIFAIDNLGNDAAAVYIDNLRLLTTSGEIEWDDMDDGSRYWFYGGNWFNWPNQSFGIEPVTHNGGNPDTPAGSIFLQWDYNNGQDPGNPVAEIGTNHLDDLSDWSPYNRLSADVKISNPDVFVSLFFWDAETSTGFSTPAKRTGVADAWQRLTWDIPWPSSFENTEIDEFKFIVNGINTIVTGSLFIDNITLSAAPLLEPLSGIVYVLDSFDDLNETQNDFNGNKGSILDQYITPTFDTTIFTGTSGASLKVDYSLPTDTLTFTGMWQSFWGDAAAPDRYLDFTKGFQQLHFWVRGSGQTTQTYNLKIELKDVSNAFDYTAYRYITIDDSDTTWREIILDADVTNADFWSYNLHPPDPTHMKQLVFVIENAFNNGQGVFYLDHIHFVVDEPEAVSGLDYIFENFDDRSVEYSDFSSNWGPLNSDYITRTFTNMPYTETYNLALRLDYALPLTSTDPPTDTFTGLWNSLWGHSDYTQSHYLDLTDFYGVLNEPDKDLEQLQFWIRGSGLTTQTHIIKVELKDIYNDFNRTAYRYIILDDSDTTWQQVVLDADVNNAAFWSYNDLPPDETKMKYLVFVLEKDLNQLTGSFYIDDIRFVDADDTPFDVAGSSDEEFLDFVSQKTFLYFLDWYDSETGLFQDRSTFPDLMSTASTGFGLTAVTIGAERGWLSETVAVEMISRTLHTLYNGHSPTSTVTETISGTNGYRGFYYHFLGNDGLRSDANSELSPIDTAILLAGILTVREYFVDEPALVALADALYERIEWDWMLEPDRDLFYLAWKPQCGPDYMVPDTDGGCFNSHVDIITDTNGMTETVDVPNLWDYYTDEAILINILAIGSPSYPVLSDVFYAWARNEGSYGEHTLTTSWNGSFFTYFFAHLWIDFSILGTDNYPTETLQVDWQENSVAAAQANWQFAVDHQDDVPCDGDDDYTTYGPLSWGLTAADGQDGYHAYGAEPVDPNAEDVPVHDGTIAPYGAGSAIIFLPVTSTLTLKHYFTETDLWRYRFGFADAYNLEPPDCLEHTYHWYNHAGFGIDQGPLLLALEDYRSGFVWQTFMQNERVTAALCAVFCDLTVTGPATTFTNLPTDFTAVLTPTLNLPEPVTYTWQATGQDPITQTGGLTNTVTYSWSTPGTKTITVTADFGTGTITAAHEIEVFVALYLPFVTKAP